MIAGAGGASSALLLAQLLEQAQQAGSALQAWAQEKLGELEHVAAERDTLVEAKLAERTGTLGLVEAKLAGRTGAAEPAAGRGRAPRPGTLPTGTQV
eukprot:g5132.t1